MNINIKNKKIIGSIAITIIFVVFLIVGFEISKGSRKSDNNDITIYNGTNETVTNKSLNITNSAKSEDMKKDIKAQIYGQVKAPGVYSLKLGQRISDLVEAAGGFTENADAYSINGAKKLTDGDNVEIKAKGEKVKSSATTNNKISSESEESTEKLNINSASEDDIVNKKIPGIGKGLAKKITQYRDSNGGRINSEKDLASAIGPKRAEKIMDYISIN